MTMRRRLPTIPSAMPVLCLSLALAACGGGGDGAAGDATTRQAVSVSSLIASDAKYSQAVLITVAGANLDAALSVTSPGCKDLVKSTALPYASSATTAYFRCTASAVGANPVTVSDASGATLATGAFTIARPQVALTVSNGLGVDGTIVVDLFPDKAPLTVDNFLAYVNAGFYDGTVFHRSVPGFVVQGGGYLPFAPGATPVAKATKPPIPLEVNKGLSNLQWTVAMARASAADSATSQFFINLVNNSAALDPGVATAGYSVFGSVVSGTDKVAAIAAAPCAPLSGFSECVPNPSVRIVSAVQTQ